MKRIPLTVLVHDGPMARAYLSKIKKIGLIPSKIIFLVYKNRPGTAKEIGKWLPNKIRLSYAKKIQEVTLNYWPRQIKKTFPEFYHLIYNTIDQQYKGSASIIEEMLGFFDFEQYAEEVEYVLVDSLNDQIVEKSIKKSKDNIILFTGGGIVRKNLLSIPRKRFLHIHPGFLPFVRGADGLLWSILVRGRPGASCFYLEEGIDIGELILKKEFVNLNFILSKQKKVPDYLTQYRALFSYYDPILRAELLAQVLSDCVDINSLVGNPQDLSRGVTYHFMHDHIRKLALSRLFIFNN